MNVLHKARAHLATLERFIDEFPAKRLPPPSYDFRDEALIGLGRQPLTTVPSEVELVTAPGRHIIDTETRPPQIVWPRPGRSLQVTRNPAFAAVASAWASITTSLEHGMASVSQHAKSADAMLAQTFRPSEPADSQQPGAVSETDAATSSSHSFVQVRDSINVLTNASRYSQTMRTPRHRLEWFRLIFGAWCFRCFRSNSSSVRQMCSACSRTVGFPSLSMPCLCPVCFDLFCPRCYGGSTLSRLFGDRGCRRCAIIVQRYEHFHGCTARLLEAGIYCVVASAGPMTTTTAPRIIPQKRSETLIVGVRDAAMLDAHINDFEPTPSQQTTGSDEIVTVASTGYTGTYSEAGYGARGMEIFPDSDDVAANRTVTCFTLQPRPLDPLGELAKSRALLLDRLTQHPLESPHLLAIPGMSKLTARCAAWFFLNVDTAEVKLLQLDLTNLAVPVRV
eukprot:Gregarina_sp_Poly_1__2699@NODE_1742_length_3426_cov_74_118190_g1141_i0_p1_GENE_NODE_1742_length_3426_cov_74_118190_g1141_i0NODE_1742_length_3426_cov_74_118190_g1141_i0_p1_ORF_typecomplete_len450_score48_59NOB1_Zn_bind/PF08772_11/4_2NOB1_Zn_bind/PF08772_11/43_NODE_1742_length_3426_cov_74_118190_g1141_i09742323